MKLWDHQKAALELLETRPANYLGHDPGVGKTRVVVEYIMRHRPHVTLVLCPLKVVPIWPREFNKWFPDHDAQILALDKGTGNRKRSRLVKFLKPNPLLGRRNAPYVVVLNYDAFWRDSMKQAIRSFEWNLLVCDECHKLKSPGSKSSWAAKLISPEFPRRVFLSGTPMPNDPRDIYGQYRALDPEIFGMNKTKFEARYVLYGGPAFNGQQRKFVGLNHEDEFKTKVGQLMHVVKKRDVHDLPPVLHEQCLVDMDKEERRIYDELKEEFIAEVEEGVITIANALTKVVRLAQATAGIGSIERTIDGVRVERAIGDSKLSWLKEMLENVPPEEPVVVFCKFRMTIQRVRMAAESLGRPVGEISGRMDTVQGVWEPQPGEVLALQWQAGGLGIDLTAGCFGVIMDPTFNGGDFQQAMARMDRPGQERPVTYYHVLARNSLDTTTLRAVMNKEKVAEAILREMK